MGEMFGLGPGRCGGSWKNGCGWEKEVVEVMAELAIQINSKGEQHDARVVDVVDDEMIVAPRRKFSSCAVVMCLMSSLSNVDWGRQITR